MARLPGRVQGVVVQITMLAPASAASDAFTTGNLVNTVDEVCSWYSTSASASAVRSTTDHITGLEPLNRPPFIRSEEHTSELQSLMRISYAVFCLKKKKK